MFALVLFALPNVFKTFVLMIMMIFFSSKLFFLCLSVNNLRHPNRINKSLMDF